MTPLQYKLDDLSDKQMRLLSHWLNVTDDEPASIPLTPPGRKELVAYITLVDKGAGIDEKELRLGLKEKLPDYMLPDRIVVLDALPRLPNGKLNAKALPTPVAKAKKPELENPSALSDTEAVLVKIWSRLLGVTPLGVHDNFFEFGGDSITSIQLVSSIREAGFEMQPAQLLDHPTIAELAAAISRSENRSAEHETISIGTAPAAPIQQWFLERKLENPDHWNLSKHLEFDQSVTPEICERAIRHLLKKHGSLNSRFQRVDDQWEIVIREADGEFVFQTHHLNRSDEKQINAIVAETNRNFEISRGPLIRFTYLNFGGDGPDELHIAAHHLLVDDVSWSIIFDDLQSALDPLICGTEPKLSNNSGQILDWLEELSAYSNSSQFESHVKYWDGWPLAEVGCVPRDMHPATAPDEASRDMVSTVFDESVTARLLGSANDAYKTKPIELLITSLGLTVRGWTDSAKVKIDMESHGREALSNNADAGNVVGWLTSYYPILLDFAPSGGEEAALISVKESYRSLPTGGLAFGIGRHLKNDRAVATRLAELQPSDILFNYLGAGSRGAGKYTSFKLVQKFENTMRCASNARSHMLEINAYVDEKQQLVFTWVYSNRIHHRKTIEAITHKHKACLENLVEFCISTKVGKLTPSDFPEMEMDQDELDQFLDTL